MNQTLALPTPLALGSIDQYVQAVNRFPLLTPDEELGLAVRFSRDNDLESAHKLVVSHLRVVVSVARGYAGYGLPQSDLIQEGNIGLMKAVKRFDPGHGVRLVSFALHWIRAEMHEYILRNWRIVKIATTKAQRKLFFNLRSMKRGLESLKPHEASLIGQQLKVSTSEVLEMEARFNGHEIALELTTNAEDENSHAPIAYLASATDSEPSCVLEQKQLEMQQSTGLTRALASLDERSRRIIEARWLREDSTVTLHDLANEFSVSAERIRQIEQKAMAKMQMTMLSAI
ncbi:RNA polymerase, sigma 32 (sigma H) factor [Candidatus Nitrotoga sp. BS]|uniref:RNA polymerase sigma factor RpoH n=1 Tax=Candidatus Nitrotoga sp. BS TaxID=2890408 RepID=UPI001EF1DF55|nr:RNA polymerase sigma factor RpoH [Candidatus Nitrotoga sp. BS]CAH1206455.1 RNA polymerase, sigma 32 (sigma H) factor [Candidatus Nitrotoga sp. BS]